MNLEIQWFESSEVMLNGSRRYEPSNRPNRKGKTVRQTVRHCFRPAPTEGTLRPPQAGACGGADSCGWRCLPCLIAVCVALGAAPPLIEGNERREATE